MKRSERRNSNCDINSISPPSVRFAIGTPPNSSRRRSTSGGGSETPPPPCTWQVSPGTGPAMQPSPLRRSDASSPILSSALSRLAPIGSPTLGNENNNPLARHGRTLILTDMGQNAQLHSLLQETGNGDDHPISFRAPELPAETLLDVCKSNLINSFLIKTYIFHSGNIMKLLQK